ncbi:MAG TPA: hypothetical protein VFX76_07295 [Roseiflexaceae bacterium]|nr:hypothetical protein [Roseiflexaceae bacterium]
MQALPSSRPATQLFSARKSVIAACVLVVLLLVSLLAARTYNALRPASLPQGTVTISQRALEEQYGLRVNLVAITGAGGFVDLRLKLVDGEKAKLLLADAKNFPALFAKTGALLQAPDHTKSQAIQFISGGNLFIMYPNAANAVTQGSPVRIVFGNMAVEPIDAK